MKLIKKIKSVGILIHEIIRPKSINNHTFLNAEKTLKLLLENPISFCRWGDGETAIISGSSIHFQKFEKALELELKACLEISKIDSRFLLGAPSIILQQNSFKLLKNKKFKIWFKTTYLFKSVFKKPQLFGDAFLFRPLDSSLAPLSIPRDSLWRNRNFILVTSDPFMIDSFKKNYSKNYIDEILIPAKDAYAMIDEIEEKIVKIISAHSKNQNIRVLISAGPTAKALVLRLYKRNIISYDIGHYYKFNQ